MVAFFMTVEDVVRIKRVKRFQKRLPRLSDGAVESNGGFLGI